MAEFTPNYNLIKPGEEDYYDVQDFNENMDAIDTVMAETEVAVQEIGIKIGTSADTGNTTIFGKLNQMANGNGGGSGMTGIRSIQRFTLNLSASKGSATQNINTVVPEKCIVLMDRFNDDTNMKTLLNYTLTANSLTASTGSYISGNITLHFQIIEFC